MIEKPAESNKHITIVGFSNVKLENVNMLLESFRKENKGAPIQFFDAKLLAGPQHLYFAALNALKAFEKKTNISNNLAVEALLYASAQRQIKKAVKMLGIKQASSEIAALIMTENRDKKTDYLHLVTKIIPGERDDSVLELTDNKIENIKKLFKISELEFEVMLDKEGLEEETLTDLLIERMALLVIRN